MQLYRVTWREDVVRERWFSHQTDAQEAADEMLEMGGTAEPVQVPRDAAGLASFLNHLIEVVVLREAAREE
jgi:hypothetical protein